MQAGSQVTKTALHYIKLKEVVNPEGAAAKLSKIHLILANDCSECGIVSTNSLK